MSFVFQLANRHCQTRNLAIQINYLADEKGPKHFTVLIQLVDRHTVFLSHPCISLV